MEQQLIKEEGRNFEDRIQVFGFEGVTNTSQLLEYMVNDIRCAIVDLNTICSLFHLKSATYKALLNEQQGNMKTKSISAEILYQLSPTTKINDSIKHYGASPDSTLIAIIVLDEDLAGLEVQSNVKGTLFDLNLLGTPAYLSLEKAAHIAKFFKVTAQELEISSLESAVLTRLATKDCL